MMQNPLRVRVRALIPALAIALAGLAGLPGMTNADQDHPMIILETSMGDITLEMYPEEAPVTVKNFVDYVESGFFDGMIFHRVIKGFMIQGGGHLPDMSQKPAGEPIVNEADNGLRNDTGTIAMARTSDPHSATAQFFINLEDNGFLNHTGKDLRGWGYAVFGKVTDGLDVVRAIGNVDTGQSGSHSDVPSEPVVIRKARVSPR